MAPTIPADVSYALCQPPSFGVRPETDIRLGTILLETDSRPKRPDTREPLNRNQIPLIDHTLLGSAPDDRELILHTETLRTASSSIWAHVDFLPGVGGRAGGERSRGQEVLIYAQEVKTTYLNPDRAFIAKALSIDTVKDQLGDFYRPVVYMVTGLKIAQRANIVIGTKKAKGMDVGPEIDLSQFGIPVNVGASIAYKFNNCDTTGIVRSEPFVLAYESRQIRVREGDHKQKLFRSFALLDDESKSDATEDMLNSLDITLMGRHADTAELEELKHSSD
jgi:hypothetical protein